MRLGKLLCALGFHRWGEERPAVSEGWFFGMGHHARGCKRNGCTCVKRKAP